MSRVAAWLTPLELTLLGAIWGASFMFQRVAAPAFGALPMVEVRLLFAVVPLLPFLWRDRASFRGPVWWRVAMVGAISNATTAIFAPLLALILFGVAMSQHRHTQADQART